MKRIFISTVMVLMIALLAAGPASAQKGKININGTVTAVENNILTIQSNKGETFVVIAPAGFDLSSIQVGDSVLVKAVAGENDSWQAQTIKQIGQKGTGAEPDDDQPEGSKLNSAYCTNGKQEKPHPLAAKMSERYGVTEQWVMDYFCDGYGMGSILLALKTSELSGVNADVETLLDERANGNGWGQIWQKLGLIGSEKEAHSPPGWLKKPDHAGPKK